MISRRLRAGLGLDQNINFRTMVNKTKMIREICVAGACIDVTVKQSIRAGRGERAARSNPTIEAVARNNNRIAEKKLTRLLNANFVPGDLFITLTYANEPTESEAKKELKNFIRRMRRVYEKHGKEFKWIAVTEFKNHRIHHHMVIPFIDKHIIKSQWKNGFVKPRTLNRRRHYGRLAAYLIKETTKIMRDPNSKIKQHWSSSRNLIRPAVMREIVQAKTLFEQPRAFKGYAIIPDSVIRYENLYTGIPQLEYMMVSTEPVPRIKKWRKGKIVKKQETIKRAAEICIDITDLYCRYCL